MEDTASTQKLKDLQERYFNRYFPFEERFVTAPPIITYHYTNVASFSAIVLGKSLWASRAEFLNDATEFRYGLEACRRAAEKISSIGESYAVFVGHLHRAMTHSSNSPFVTCFCRDGDLLSQWRAYSPHGQGLSIGFRSELLRKVQGANIENVIYDREIQDEFLYGHIKILADEFLSSDVDLNTQEPFMRLVGYTGALERSAAIMKDAAFREESETRIFVPDYNVDVSKIKFRPRNNLVIPYIELGFEPILPLAISNIIIGPGPDPETRKKNIEHFLALNKLDDVEVRTSKCQLRQ